MTRNDVLDKCISFSIKINKLRKYLCEKQREYNNSDQIQRSGTSIGANIKEALRGQSRPDFTAKMSISLKEASECEYWIELLMNTEYLPSDSAQSLLEDCQELIKILVSIVKSTNER